MNTDAVLAIQRRLARQRGAPMSEEVLQAAADLATVEALRAELARVRDVQAQETAVQARNESRWRGALTAAQAAVEEERELRAQAESEKGIALALLEGQKRATVALEAELRETIAGLMRERDAAIKDLTAARNARTDAWIENKALLKDIHTTLTTIGGRLYTQGTGAAWQMDLLSFVRNERERFDRSTVALEPPPPEAGDNSPSNSA